MGNCAVCLSSFPWLWLRQGLASLAYEGRDIVSVIYVGDVEIVLRTLVGRTEFFFTKHQASRLGGLHIKVVVTNKSEYFSVAVDAVVAEHLPGHDVAGSAALVGDVLYKIYVACHDIYRLGEAVDFRLQGVQEAGGFVAVHLRVVELEGDGERGLEERVAVLAPDEEGVVVNAGIDVHCAVYLTVGQG